MEYYILVLIFRKHKAYIAGSKSPALPYHRRGKTRFQGWARAGRGGSRGISHSIAFNPSHCHSPTERKLLDQRLSYLKLGQKLFGLYKYLSSYTKDSITCLFLCTTTNISTYMKLVHSIQYHVSYVPEIHKEVKKALQAENGKTFFFAGDVTSLSSTGFCCYCHSLWWKKKSTKNPLDFLSVWKWQCSTLLTFSPKFGWCELSLSQIQTHFWNTSISSQQFPCPGSITPPT